MSERLSRRDFIAGATSTLALIGCCNVAQASGDDDLAELSAGDAAAAMRRGDITAESYASALLARCEAARDLQAFISLDAAMVLESARACDRERLTGRRLPALHGLPIPIKDSINTKDYPTTAGTPALRHFRPTADAPIVQALRNAGAFVLGKTNMHELSFGWTSNNHAYGAVRNPYDPAHVAGGSSGGTAVAIAARMAPLGVAEDTEGSALRKLQDAGAQIVAVPVPDLAHLIELSTAAIQSYDFRPSVIAYLQRYGAGISYEQLLSEASLDVRTDIANYASPGGHYYASAERYGAARSKYLPALRRTFREYFRRTGAAAVVFPTTMIPAPLVGEDTAVTIRGQQVSLDTALGRNVDPGSTAGLPGLVLPSGRTAKGLPVSLEFDSPAGTDRALLSLGLHLEAALGQIAGPAI